MLLMNLIFPIFMYFIGIIVFSSKRKHLLLMLLSLEFIVLSLYYFLMVYLNMYNYEYYFSLMFLVFSVCEGVLGLSILVSLIRTHGNDYFQLMNIMQC
uniref:NADH-ubiquinone oxidoreductase chain 4L n=1 Tax=Sphaerius sp. BT0074 TaxID=546487 RepID=B6D8V3_9COLE|nr:NADH dehydrogenase subunit 4L [Sphaerius sp. BT0074]ACF35091.1 NADH dehydrogenase subunit 4L [Sphaerius sp. BT0074]